MSTLVISRSTRGRRRSRRHAVTFSAAVISSSAPVAQNANDGGGSLARALRLQRIEIDTIHGSPLLPKRSITRVHRSNHANALSSRARSWQACDAHQQTSSFPWPAPARLPPTSAARSASFTKSGCFVIPNPWSVGTARYLQHLGFKALATTSSGFAHAHGYADGEVPRDTDARAFPRDRRGRRRAGQRRLRGRLRRRRRRASPRTYGAASRPASPGCRSRIRPATRRTRSTISTSRSRACAPPAPRSTRPAATWCSPRARRVSSAAAPTSTRRCAGSRPLPTPAPIASMRPASRRARRSPPW